MELTHAAISKWFDLYFDEVRKNQGNLETVPKLKRYFTSDFEFMMYSAPAQGTREPMSREALLVSFVHPGLQEDIYPRHYAIDVSQMIAAVQFEIRFSDKPSGKEWPPIQASAHYHLIADENKDLKIRKIEYWTEALPGDLFEVWSERRAEALTKHAVAYINHNAV